MPKENPKVGTAKRTAIIIGVLLLLLFPLFATWFNQHVVPQEITVVFRYDDYSSCSSTNFETKLIDTFKRYDVPCTFGIIPYVASGDGHNFSSQEVIPLSEEKVHILRTAMDSGIIEPALHGYSHQTIKDCRKSGCTEFSGLSYEKQMKKIVKGKKLLEDGLNTKITIFIPPWNSYDMNTLQCLERFDFNCISADLRGVSEESSHLRFLPKTTTIPELRQAVNSARRSSDPQAVIIVLFHDYEFVEIGDDRGEFTYQEFSDLLSWITSQKNIHVSSMSQLIKENDFDATRFQENREFHTIIQLIPPLLSRSLGLEGVYFSSQYLSPTRNFRICVIVVSYTLLILLFSAIITFFIGIPLFRRFPVLGKFCQYCIPLLLVFLLIYSFKDLSIGYTGFAAIIFILGIHIGVWKSLVKIKKSSL
jgi:peptidoglycan/xylan/chitin deacetylase (PgdA/CDA1 family)